MAIENLGFRWVSVSALVTNKQLEVSETRNLELERNASGIISGFVSIKMPPLHAVFYEKENLRTIQHGWIEIC